MSAAAIAAGATGIFRGRSTADDKPQSDLLDDHNAGLVKQVAELVRRVKELEKAQASNDVLASQRDKRLAAIDEALGMLGGRVAAVEGRYVVETGAIDIGRVNSNNTEEWIHDFPSNTVFVTGQVIEWIANPGAWHFGSAVPMVEQIAYQRQSNGAFRVHVKYNPRWGSPIDVGFHYILVRTP